MTESVLNPLPRTLLPEQIWEIHDDECDCTFQRIGFWTNPYMGETMRVRLCCVWAEMEKTWPEFFQHTHAAWDYNKDEWSVATQTWDGETQMERAVWYRQLANEQGLPLDVIREKYRLEEPPAGRQQPKEEPQVQAQIGDIFSAYGQLYMEKQQVLTGLEQTLAVLRGVKDGSLSLNDIEFHDNGFTLKGDDHDEPTQ